MAADRTIYIEEEFPLKLAYRTATADSAISHVEARITKKSAPL